MKSLLMMAFTLVLFSCTENGRSGKTDLLTSLTWTIEKGSIDGEMPRSKEMYKFLADGTYLLEAGKIKVNGKWRWTEEGEIYLQTEGVTINGQVNKFDSNSNSFIRVVELTDKTLRTLERGEGDTWDSGFAKEKTYAAQNL